MKLLLGLFIFTLTFAYGQKQQSFSYSFSGVIDSSFVSQLEKESMEIEGVTAAKARYKVEKKKGEILLFTEMDEDQKDPNIFSPSEIKAILLRNGLEPLQFTKLKTD